MSSRSLYDNSNGNAILNQKVEKEKGKKEKKKKEKKRKKVRKCEGAMARGCCQVDVYRGNVPRKQIPSALECLL